MSTIRVEAQRVTVGDVSEGCVAAEVVHDGDVVSITWENADGAYGSTTLTYSPTALVKVRQEDDPEPERDDRFTVTPVCIDELVTVWAQYDPRYRWNGWLMPRIDPWAAERVLTLIAAEHKATGEPDRLTWSWEDDATLVLTETYGPEPDDVCVERIEPDADGLVALGAGSWVWQEDTDTGAEEAADKGVGNPSAPSVW